MVEDSLIGQRWAVMRDALDERQRRLLAAAEAKVLGRGGVSAVSIATGVSRTTIMVGLGEIKAMQSCDDTAASEPVVATNARQSGGGRRELSDQGRNPAARPFVARGFNDPRRPGVTAALDVQKFAQLGR